MVAWGDRDYPSWLAEAADAPLSLYALGDRRLLQPPAVAIVGSRRCTSYGKCVSTQLRSDLATAGVTIVSGLARGIDGVAYEGALHAGGATIAVLGGGVDVIYPRDHAKLYRQIQADGLLLAESPLGTPPERSSFPRRNRIVSGLAQAVVVVEAPERSGALMTARLARKQGREVFAVPGEITNPRCAGCLSLRRDGAGLTRGAKDVIYELKVHLPTAWGDEMAQARSIDDANPLLEALQSGEHGVESLASPGRAVRRACAGSAVAARVGWACRASTRAALRTCRLARRVGRLAGRLVWRRLDLNELIAADGIRRTGAAAVLVIERVTKRPNQMLDTPSDEDEHDEALPSVDPEHFHHLTHPTAPHPRDSVTW